MTAVIKVENLSKQYRLGVIGSSTIKDDLQRWWYTMRGRQDLLGKVSVTKPDPNPASSTKEAQRSGTGSLASTRPAAGKQIALPETILALDNVSFEVQQGEILGIIGRNGAGKSTLLKILSRVTAPTTGHIKVKGRIASLLEVGTGFHPELTGRENVFLNGAILGMTRAEVARKFDEIVDFSGVSKFIDTPVKRYSSGMYVRLAFAVAAHLEPEILIIDEVLAVGDFSFQRKCLGKMSEVAAGGRTVLFVSHNMSAVKSLTNKGLYLKDGCVHEYGETTKVVNNYLQATTGESALVFDLKQEIRGHGAGEQVIMTELIVNDNKSVKHGEPLKLALTLSCNLPVDGVAIGIGFNTSDGNRIMALDSEMNSSYWHLEPGLSVCIINMDRCDLQPSTYMLDIVVRSGDTAYLDSLASSIKIDVLPGPSTPPQIIRSGGQVRLPAKWSIERR